MKKIIDAVTENEVIAKSNIEKVSLLNIFTSDSSKQTANICRTKMRATFHKSSIQ